VVIPYNTEHTLAPLSSGHFSITTSLAIGATEDPYLSDERDPIIVFPGKTSDLNPRL
jgi:hypothetical protein